MIGKAELREKLLQLLASADSPSAMQQVMPQFLSYSIENYENLDAEAKAHLNSVFEELKRQARKAAAVLPEGGPKRNLERVLGTVEGHHFNAADFLSGLESSIKIELPILPAARAAFTDLLQRILDFLFDVTRRIHQGFPIFAITGLFYWAVDELLVAIHLAQRGFANQCYAHIRTVDEILDKAQLFHEKPQWATLWATGSDREVWNELKPAEVRKKLGEPKYDPMYAFFSALGPHGTFKGLQARTALYANPKDEDRRMLKIWVGGTPQVRHIVWTNTMCVYSAVKTLARCSSILAQWLNPEEVAAVNDSAVETTKAFFREHYVAWAKGEGLNVAPIIEFLESGVWRNPPEDSPAAAQ